MSWLEHHRRSAQLAGDAELAARNGDTDRARELYALAAEAEEAALGDTAPEKTRTLGISAVSAVSLYYKGACLRSAERVACQWVQAGGLPEFAIEQLRGLLQSIWSEQARQRADVGFAPGHVLVSVKGGEVIEGGAPLDLIVEKVQTVQALFYRTAEFLRGMPHRVRGGPTKEIVDSCRPWLFQTAPGSYQFAVAVQQERQGMLFEGSATSPQAIAEKFMLILRATVDDPEGQLPKVVSDDRYRATFLKLTRNLAPTGKRFREIEVRSATELEGLHLNQSTRNAVGHAIRTVQRQQQHVEGSPESIRGVLRAVHLDRDWIEVTVEGTHVRIGDVGEAVDDVIGPMVNHAVVVQAFRVALGGLQFRDIELDE